MTADNPCLLSTDSNNVDKIYCDILFIDDAGAEKEKYLYYGNLITPVADIIDKHSADITKLLKALCDKGILISCGFGRGTKYQINEEYEPSSLQNDDSNDARNGDSKG